MRRLLSVLPFLVLFPGCASWRMQTVTPEELGGEMQASAPAKLRPLQLASLGSPVPPQMKIQPGDVLDVTVSDLIGENQYYPVPTRVLEDGTVRLPLVGSVTLAGLSLPGAEQAIFAAYCSQGILKKPQVTVALRETRKVRVFVLGAVNKPGQYELNANEADLLSALVNAGGLTQDASTMVELRRRMTPGSAPVPGRKDRNVVQSSYRTVGYRPQYSTLPEPAPIAVAGNDWDKDYPDGSAGNSPYHPVGANGTAAGPARNLPASVLRAEGTIEPEPASRTIPNLPDGRAIHLDLTNEQDKQRLTQGFRLENGDIISIDDRKAKPIYVIGMVNKPGEFQMPVDRDLRVLEAIGLAAGVDRNTIPDKALVIRQRPDGSGVLAIRVDLSQAKKDNSQNIRLMAGDTLSVEETVASYTRGLLRGALRFGVGASWAPTATGF
jgi:protein involved in polysaccharide export with SLBB domain